MLVLGVDWKAKLLLVLLAGSAAVAARQQPARPSRIEIGRDGAATIVLNVNEDGNASISMQDKKGVNRIVFEVSPDGEGAIAVTAPDGGGEFLITAKPGEQLLRMLRSENGPDGKPSEAIRLQLRAPKSGASAPSGARIEIRNREMQIMHLMTEYE